MYQDLGVGFLLDLAICKEGNTVRKRSRLTLMVLAIVMALVLSSCWQIRRVGVNRWQIDVSETATVTLDLAKDGPATTSEGYPFVLIGFSDNLRNAGKKWDAQGNFGGPESGVKDQALKLSLLGDEGFCDVGGAALSEVESAYANWIALRMSDQFDLATVGDNDILRFKHSLGIASGATVPGTGYFMYISGLFGDDGDLVAEPGETVCQSVYTGAISLVAPGA